MLVDDDRSIAQAIGEFVVRSDFDRLPEPLVHEAKRSLLNFIAAALGVTRDPAFATAVAVTEPFRCDGPCRIIGLAETTDPLSASFLNAIAGNLLDFDDTHLDTVIHPTAPVVPAAFALGEYLGASGPEVLHAFILGAEIECRIGNAVSPEHYARGWHITTTCGVFGAAAAAAKLLGLDADGTANALGIAASQSAGVVANLAHGAKNVSVGNSARNGMQAALFAERGYTGDRAAIEGALGWARAGGVQADVDEILGALDTRWELAKNTYKPYPCGIVMHAVVDACLALREAYRLTPADIDSVQVSGDELLLARGDRVVEDHRDARVSIHHAVAAPLLWGRADIGSFTHESVFSDDAIAMRDKVVACLDSGLPTGAARVVVQTCDGRRLEQLVLQAKGSVEDPLEDVDIEAKLRALASVWNTVGSPDELIRRVWAIDELGSISELTEAAGGSN
jgi:2-methylcitrate dehydratase PrpD